MRHQEDSPKYWQHWLRDRGVADAVAQHINEIYRALRGAHERMWTFAYAGAIGGAAIGARVAVFSPGRGTGWIRLTLVMLGAALAASLAWWVSYWLMRRSALRSLAPLLTGHELQGEDPYVDRVVNTVAERLATSQYRPRDEKAEMNQLTQATIVTGLREAPTSELERSLLERLVGSAFVPTLDGGIFIFKLGPPCTRCKARTRTGSLRLLQVPGHWAAANGYQRLNDLPARGQHLRVVPQKTQELTLFLGNTGATAERPMFFGPKADVLLCETCGKEAIRRGLLQSRDR
jgi:hypothetical protein